MIPDSSMHPWDLSICSPCASYLRDIFLNTRHIVDNASPDGITKRRWHLQTFTKLFWKHWNSMRIQNLVNSNIMRTMTVPWSTSLSEHADHLWQMILAYKIWCLVVFAGCTCSITGAPFYELPCSISCLHVCCTHLSFSFSSVYEKLQQCITCAIHFYLIHIVIIPYT